MAVFRLKDSFVHKYIKLKPPFGFHGLGEFVDLRTYSRIKSDGTNEVWYEQCRRVVEGTYQMQKDHIESQDLGWSDVRAQKSAQEMYDRMFYMKFMPSGRGMWAMGSPLTTERKLFAALFSCAFISTEAIDKELAEPFTFLMDASMLGIGVGFDTLGAGKLTIHRPWYSNSLDPITTIIPDSREGWVESVKLLLESYFVPGLPQQLFDYRQIRAAGKPIKGFGGFSSGMGPLKALHERIREVLDALDGRPITQTAIVDIMNHIGACVVAGNIRRSAEIVFGSPDSEEYVNLKNYKWVPKNILTCPECEAAVTVPGHYAGRAAHRAGHGWTSNNSVFAELGMDYNRIAQLSHNNGEPGYMWLENARDFGRLSDPPNGRDRRVKGANPCSEQSLESGEACCLVETYPANHNSLDDYKRTLKCAYLYAKTVTLSKTHWPKTNKVMLRNRRIGTSMSGIQQFIAREGLHVFKQWCEEGYQAIQQYDRTYSEWLAVPRSIKTTSVKPSGTVSLVAGATPGMHWPESRWYKRRVRVAKGSPYITRFQAANYTVEDCVSDPSSMVVEFPIALAQNIKTLGEVSLWEQFAMAAFMQKYWADNQVSCTVSFDPNKVDAAEIARALDHFQYDLKGISLLPKTAAGAYPQMPYEEITQDEYERLAARLGDLNLSAIAEESEPERGCNSDVCELKSWQPSPELAAA